MFTFDICSINFLHKFGVLLGKNNLLTFAWDIQRLCFYLLMFCMKHSLSVYFFLDIFCTCYFLKIFLKCSSARVLSQPIESHSKSRYKFFRVVSVVSIFVDQKIFNRRNGYNGLNDSFWKIGL